MSWYDLALCIDNNDNQMTFVRAYSLFVSLVASFAPSLRSVANDATRATNKLYALQKSCNCPICLNDITEKCNAGATHTSASSPQLLHRSEKFVSERNRATVSCKRGTTTRSGVKSASLCPSVGLERVAHAYFS